jgi:hypothetical protein
MWTSSLLLLVLPAQARSLTYLLLLHLPLFYSTIASTASAPASASTCAHAPALIPPPEAVVAVPPSIAPSSTPLLPIPSTFSPPSLPPSLPLLHTFVPLPLLLSNLSNPLFHINSSEKLLKGQPRNIPSPFLNQHSSWQWHKIPIKTSDNLVVFSSVEELLKFDEQALSVDGEDLVGV